MWSWSRQSPVYQVCVIFKQWSLACDQFNKWPLSNQALKKHSGHGLTSWTGSGGVALHITYVICCKSQHRHCFKYSRPQRHDSLLICHPGIQRTTQVSIIQVSINHVVLLPAIWQSSSDISFLNFLSCFCTPSNLKVTHIPYSLHEKGPFLQIFS